MANAVSIMLVGFGPHSKRIYVHYLNKHHLSPEVIVDLQSKKSEIDEYVRGVEHDIEAYYVPDSERNNEELSAHVKMALKSLIQKRKITHVIISTEPKAHYAYGKFFLSANVHVLLDKPITAPTNVSNDIKMANRILEDYKVLAELYETAKAKGLICQVQCQRRWHKGYRYIRNLIKECIDTYKIPITMINIYHCDGMWNMPDEFLYRENHPYKYGYGKLLHSGYHFIDLLCWLLVLNNGALESSYETAKISTAVMRPYDFLKTINNRFYHSFMKTNQFDQIYSSLDQYGFKEFGEVDSHALIQFYNDDAISLTCSLNLLQSGFSRRSWTALPEDTYKSNGRVRHEHVNIQLGPLLNIQVHSYQSKEIKDRTKDDFGEPGTIEHFDIDIYRNVDIVGGKPFERVKITDLCKIDDENNFIGFNEAAREDCLKEFLSNGIPTSDLLDHELSVKILANHYKSICLEKKTGNSIIACSLAN